MTFLDKMELSVTNDKKIIISTGKGDVAMQDFDPSSIVTPSSIPQIVVALAVGLIAVAVFRYPLPL